MTSKNFFFKAMREDVRHKLWMVVLSALGNFLVLVVGWMIWRGEALSGVGGVRGALGLQGSHLQSILNGVVDFSHAYVTCGGGLVAMAVAVTAGLASFRYVFHRRMTDTYHSLPISRGALYGVGYLNGILIWFIPFIVSALAVFLLACSLLAQLGGGDRIPELAGGLLLSMVVLTVMYLLVYHVALLAVMLCGNALNTLFSMMFLGVGAIGIYGLTVAFFDAYMGTYFTPAISIDSMVYFSPLFAAPWLMVLRMDGLTGWGLWSDILINLAVALLLGAAAWMLYRRRASEVAEQGIWSKKVAALFRFLTGVAAGVCGWAFFALLLTDFQAGWGIFGVILGAVCVSGVLDILFQMDFKAFFSHKWQMAGTVAAALFLCFAFYGDWFGYDTYLPDQEKIASVAVYDSCLSNRYFYYDVSETGPVEEMRYEDSGSLYAFLERMTEHERRDRWEGERERVAVKVTLDSGRSYYRNYYMAAEDKELAWPLFTSEEYLKHAYLIDEEEMRNLRSFTMDLGAGGYPLDPEGREAAAIIEAYNQDVLENREAVLLGQGKWLAEAELTVYCQDGDRRRHEDITMEVYDFMSRTREAMKEAGMEPLGLEDLMVESIVLPLDRYVGNMAPRERVAAAREQYGVPERPGGSRDGDGRPAAGSEGMISGEFYPEAERVTTRDMEIDDSMYDLSITDPAEMEEVFGLLGYGTNAWRSNGIFGKRFTRVILICEGGRSREWLIPMGVLPEKYILRFGE